MCTCLSLKIDVKNSLNKMSTIGVESSVMQGCRDVGMQAECQLLLAPAVTIITLYTVTTED